MAEASDRQTRHLFPGNLSASLRAGSYSLSCCSGWSPPHRPGRRQQTAESAQHPRRSALPPARPCSPGCLALAPAMRLPRAGSGPLRTPGPFLPALLLVKQPQDLSCAQPWLCSTGTTHSCPLTLRGVQLPQQTEATKSLPKHLLLAPVGSLGPDSSSISQALSPSPRTDSKARQEFRLARYQSTHQSSHHCARSWGPLLG